MKRFKKYDNVERMLHISDWVGTGRNKRQTWEKSKIIVKTKDRIPYAPVCGRTRQPPKNLRLNFSLCSLLTLPSDE